jgi:hypothetical protein
MSVIQFPISARQLCPPPSAFAKRITAERNKAADAAAAKAAAPDSDPIYAAIEHHRVAEEALAARCSYLADLDTPEAEEELSALSEAESDARDELMKVGPTSTAGVAALLRYVLFYERYGMALEDILDLKLLAKALAKIKA